eukprot:CAMPEP_0194266752 /NCGR_PEP_ID=MMETSP0169-20130528/1552_1 /TAXON_ID=218684 /ORGANISM="Corethron pennatum, Strain L29A3" /LENGTH=950 /DNA_ID=CAMNT_0039007509 /DNA_START=102 /DNA_END=2954 /DNA_ORIENTATION=-
MASSNELYCTFTLASDVTAGGLPSQEDICKDLEDHDTKIKIRALKAAVLSMLSGETLPRVLMQVIRFCINTDDKQLKKLTMLYWEIVPKYQEKTNPNEKGKLLPEMILVCNALMNDLNHPNEYVRGSMLRFITKIKDEEIVGPLVASIKACLEHRHSYVRKNAALAVFHLHKLFGEDLMPDGPELMQSFIMVETDTGARRNAFLMLFNQAEDAAIEFLATNIESVAKFGDGFALLVLELTRRVCRRDPQQKSRFVRVLFQMLSSTSSAVSYEAAWTLVSLSSAPTAVRAAASTYATLLNNNTDNNVKMIVLERLEELKKKHSKVLQEILMDILRALSSPSPDICKKVLDVCMDIVSARNVAEVMTNLKREVLKTQESDMEKGTVYRAMLIESIHQCASRFPDVADGVVHTLMDFLGGDGALQVILFVRAIVEQYPVLRRPILTKLVESLDSITAPNVMSIALWILGQYPECADSVKEAFEAITEQVGEEPYASNEDKPVLAQNDGAPKFVTKNVVLSDGTYATQTVYNEPKAAKVDTTTPFLRKAIIGGDIFLGTVLFSALTKLSLRSGRMEGANVTITKGMSAKTLLVTCGVMKVAENNSDAQKSSVTDCKEKATMCCKVLLDAQANAMLGDILLNEGKASFSNFLKAIKEKEQKEKHKVEEGPTTQADDLIHFRQLRSNAAQGGDIDLDDGSDLLRATGGGAGSDYSSELSHVYQLSGFADPVYAEALVTVHDYDIVLDILVINRTNDTLSNLTVEIATMGDMKIVERPQTYTLGPQDQTTIRASIKVSSTETGHIFGTLVYENASNGEKGYINLNDIHMDIMDYIRPAFCTDEVFRSMWAEFEWENKVAISTTISALVEFLDHIISSTNMRCLTPFDREAKSTFVAANLYARSVFGEDALVNVSVEKKEDGDGKLAGYIRIRSKTQGIALSLGDRITSVQRALPESK